MVKILIAEDEKVTRLSMRKVLERSGFCIIEAADGREAVELFRQESPAGVILDLKMPVMDGMDAISEMKAVNPDVPVIVVTAHGDIAVAVETMKLGAYDFLEKPVEPAKLIVTVRRALEKFTLEKELDRLHISEDASLEWTLGKGPAIRKVIEQIKQIAATNFSIILQGETGTGKTYMAKVLHNISRRAGKPFVKIDLGSMPETLMESEIFGYEKGAFTGAVQDNKGYFEIANGGTVLIDDLENLTPLMQGKLLNVVESKEISRIGSRKSVGLDIRIIAATNKYIHDCIKEGTFREDLFFRLGEFIITLPPLRDRREDILFLAGKFLEDATSELSKQEQVINDEAADYLTGYNWPGNIRQLKNVMRRAVLFSDERIIRKEHLDFLVKRNREAKEELPLMPLKDAVSNIEAKLIREAIKATKGNKTRAASILQVDVKTLRAKIAEYRIDDLP